MSQMISTFYAMKVPDLGKTTYNVGLIQGGTSAEYHRPRAAKICIMSTTPTSGRPWKILDRLFENCIATYRSMGGGGGCGTGGQPALKGDVDNSHLVELVPQRRPRSMGWK